MPNEIGWGAAVSNLIGWGKASEDGDNFIDESALELFETEINEFLLTQSPTFADNGWGEMYDYSYWGDTILER
jgi:hypothetical protein